MKWFKLALNVVGVVLGVIAVLLLMRSHPGFTLNSFINGLLDGWDVVLRVTIGVAAQSASNLLKSLFGFRPDLQPHWRTIYTLLQLYFLKDAANFGELGQKIAGRASYIAGTLLAILAAIIVAQIPLTPFPSWANFWVGFVPICAFLTYAITMALVTGTWHREDFAKLKGTLEPFGKFVKRRVRMAFVRSGIGILILGAFVFVAPFQQPTIAALALLWLLLALLWIARGWSDAAARAKRDGISLPRSLAATGNIQLGTEMLATLGIALFVAAFAE